MVLRDLGRRRRASRRRVAHLEALDDLQELGARARKRLWRRRRDVERAGAPCREELRDGAERPVGHHDVVGPRSEERSLLLNQHLAAFHAGGAAGDELHGLIHHRPVVGRRLGKDEPVDDDVLAGRRVPQEERALAVPGLAHLVDVETRRNVDGEAAVVGERAGLTGHVHVGLRGHPRVCGVAADGLVSCRTRVRAAMTAGEQRERTQGEKGPRSPHRPLPPGTVPGTCPMLPPSHPDFFAPCHRVPFCRAGESTSRASPPYFPRPTLHGRYWGLACKQGR